MPLVHRILITLRTLMEDDPEPPYNRKRRSNNSNRTNNRNSQTSALILTFRDLFRSGGLNVILDEMDMSRRPSRRNSRNQSVSNRVNDCVPNAVLCSANQPRHEPDSRLVLRHQDASVMTPYKPSYEDETIPLLHEETIIVPCRELVLSPIPFQPRGLFSNLALVARKKKKPENLTVPLNTSDESKTVETLRKVLKWSPRKQNSATFAVSVPIEEKHSALAVVENAVNTVKEEQLRKKKRKFLWLKLC